MDSNLVGLPKLNFKALHLAKPIEFCISPKAWHSTTGIAIMHTYFKYGTFWFWFKNSELSINHKTYSVSVWHFFIWAWLPCSLGIFWFRSTLFGTTNFVKWTMTQLRLTKPHWLSWKILSPPVFESFLEIWHWVWETVKSHIFFIRCIQPKLNLRICKFLCLRFCNLKKKEEVCLHSFLKCKS